ncbi:unnamed protein product [Clavelina lepadiformis]|uniref:Uncharacterized protein n=1 Tax=Clavelina lepadiformis TaxID=159417 RepID=A0ABP0H414_CLALP
MASATTLCHASLNLVVSARRRLRSETVLREKLARKERETEEFAKEVTSLRTLLIDQKKTIEQLRMDLDAEAKCRARCADLELQISQLNRYITEVHGELRARDDILKGNEAEREALLQMNAELREVNSDQKNKLEACERDVTATQMELEILEEIVQALNDRKSTVFNSRANSPAPQSSATPDLMHLRYNTAPKSPGANKGILSSTPPPYRSKTETLPFETSIIAEASKPAATSIISKLAVGSKQSSSDMNGNTDESRKLTDRQSAMSALKSLQKEHSDKCSFLAQHIQKLKEENKAKEDTISRLQTKTQKVSP